jgi:hypothetical protein
MLCNIAIFPDLSLAVQERFRYTHYVFFRHACRQSLFRAIETPREFPAITSMQNSMNTRTFAAR